MQFADILLHYTTNSRVSYRGNAYFVDQYHQIMALRNYYQVGFGCASALHYLFKNYHSATLGNLTETDLQILVKIDRMLGEQFSWTSVFERMEHLAMLQYGIDAQGTAESAFRHFHKEKINVDLSCLEYSDPSDNYSNIPRPNTVWVQQDGTPRAYNSYGWVSVILPPTPEELERRRVARAERKKRQQLRDIREYVSYDMLDRDWYDDWVPFECEFNDAKDSRKRQFHRDNRKNHENYLKHKGLI